MYVVINIDKAKEYKKSIKDISLNIILRDYFPKKYIRYEYDEIKKEEFIKIDFENNTDKKIIISVIKKLKTMNIQSFVVCDEKIKEYI